MASNPISTLPAAQAVSWTGRSSIASSADGYLELKDSAGTAFTGLRFGGTSSSFPMLKRSSATLQARLADDSGYAAMAMGGLTVNGTATATTSVLAPTFGDANGTAFTSGYGLMRITLGYIYFGLGDDSRIGRQASGLFLLSNNSVTSYIGCDANHVTCVRNSTNAQTLRVYRTESSSLANYERVAIQTGSGYGQLAVESAGTGTANMDLALTPAGTGNLKFGTHSAIGAETVTGYITIKDSGGTTRKLAVVS